MNRINKKLNKLALPISTNANIIMSKNNIKLLKIERGRCIDEESRTKLDLQINLIGKRIHNSRLKELNKLKNKENSQILDYKRQQYNLFNIAKNTFTSEDYYIFSRKYMRKKGVDKGISIRLNDVYVKNGPSQNIKYIVKAVTESYYNHKSIFVILEEFEEHHIRYIHIPLYQFVKDFSLNMRKFIS